MSTPLSILIVNWNTRERVRQCLLALERVPLARASQVIVVDNASTDGSLDMLATFEWVETVANDQNVGFGMANNRALAQATGDYVLFLNPDTEVAQDALESMLRFLDAYPRVGVVGTTLWNTDGTLQPSCHSYYSFFNTLVHNRFVEALTDRWRVAPAQRSGAPEEVDWMTGACLMVRRTALAEVRGFDPDYFLYGEEIDLQFRLRRLSWQVVYVPSQGVVHHSGESARQAPLAATLHNYRGRWLFVRKHYPWWSAAAYLAKTIVVLSLWLGYWSVRGSGAEARQQWRAYGRLLAWHIGTRGTIAAPQVGA